MIEVNRYAVNTLSGIGSVKAVVSTNGRYVLFDDYEALQQNLEDMEVALCAMLPGVKYMDPPDGGSVTPIEQVRRMVNDLQHKLDAVTAENVALKESRQRLGEFIIEEIKADYPLNMELETPATDAIINALRAEGVELAAQFLTNADTVGSTGAMGFALHNLAAQLRNGEHIGEEGV